MGLSCLDHRGASYRLGQARGAAWRRWLRLGLGWQRGLECSRAGPVEEAMIIMTITVTVSLD